MKKLLIPLMILISLNLVAATVTLEVTAFNCSPDEVTVTEGFSCTATVDNTGDETGSLTTATLYSDAANWLEESSYAETVNTNINSGASTDIVFEGLRAQKSGEFGFSRITLDEVSDTYPADNSVSVNVIDVITAVSQSANSAAASTGTIDASAQVTVGGDTDLVISFSVVSGGCGIGNQASSSSFSDLSDGQSISQTWTITMGTSNCVYRISSAITSNPSGTATKTDSTTKTITCSGSACTTTPVTDSSSSSSSSSSGRGSGVAGGGSKTPTVISKEEDIPNQAPEYAIDENTIDLDNYQTWTKSGKTSIGNLQKGQTITFTFVTGSLEEQDWIIVVEDIDIENNMVVLFIKQEDGESTEIRVSLNKANGIDLDKDGTVDVTINLSEIQENGVTLDFEKTSTFVAQEQKFVEKKRFIGLFVSLGILAVILFSIVIYFFVRTKAQPLRKEESPRRQSSR